MSNHTYHSSSIISIGEDRIDVLACLALTPYTEIPKSLSLKHADTIKPLTLAPALQSDNRIAPNAWPGSTSL